MSHLDQAAALATVDKTPEQRKRLLLLSKLADGLSTESLERIATAMPHILAEALDAYDVGDRAR